MRIVVANLVLYCLTVCIKNGKNFLEETYAESIFFTHDFEMYNWAGSVSYPKTLKKLNQKIVQTLRKNKSKNVALPGCTPSSTLGEWHIFGCACLKHKCSAKKAVFNNILSKIAYFVVMIWDPDLDWNPINVKNVMFPQTI